MDVLVTLAPFVGMVMVVLGIWALLRYRKIPAVRWPVACALASMALVAGLTLGSQGNSLAVRLLAVLPAAASFLVLPLVTRRIHARQGDEDT